MSLALPRQEVPRAHDLSHAVAIDPEAWIGSAAFAAAAGISSLRTAQAILRAAAEGLPWQGAQLDVRLIEGKRGGASGACYQVRVASLPPAVLARVLAARGQTSPEATALAMRSEVGAQIQQRIAEAGLQATPPRGEGGEARIEAKLAVLAAWDLYRARTTLSTRRALEAFVLAVRQGQIALPPVVRAALPDLSRASLQRWQRQLRQDGLARLAGRYGPGPRASVWARHPELARYALGLLAHHPTIRGVHVHAALAAKFPGLAPDRRTVQRFLADYRATHRGTLTHLANPDAWRSKYEVAYGDWDAGITRLNQQWELDSTPADLMLVDGRHVLVGCIDVYSRRLTLLVAKTSKAAAVAAVLRRAFLAWGMPEEAVTDQGQDYISRHIRSVLAALGITHTPRPPYQPRMKPFIERAFKTFSHDLVELLPGYIGHNVAEREAIRARQSFAERLFQPEGTVELRMTAAELQDCCDGWTGQLYHRRRHRELGMSPAQRAEAWEHPVQRIQNVRALDLLLIPSGWRVVQKKGIEYERAWFISPELALLDAGTRVEVRNDPADVGRLYVFGEGGEHLCTAECPERTGISRAEVAVKARAMQRAQERERLAVLEALKREVTTAEAIEAIWEDRAAAARPADPWTGPEGLPYETPALRAAADAVAADASQPEAFPLAEAPIMPRRALPLVEDPQELEEPRDTYLRLSRLAEWTQEEAEWMARNRTLNAGISGDRYIEADVAKRGDRSPYAPRYWREHGTASGE